VIDSVSITNNTKKIGVVYLSRITTNQEIDKGGEEEARRLRIETGASNIEAIA
jgi:hypothetical protein